jgi:hypothetical protein
VMVSFFRNVTRRLPACPLVICWVLVCCGSGTAVASCGDYLMPLGENHGAPPDASQHNKNNPLPRLADVLPQRIPCHGPYCGGVPASSSEIALPAPPNESVSNVAQSDSKSLLVPMQCRRLSSIVIRISAIYRVESIFKPPIL